MELTIQTSNKIKPQVKRFNIDLSLFQFMPIRECEVPDSQGNQAKKQTVPTFTAGNAQQAQRSTTMGNTIAQAMSLSSHDNFFISNPFFMSTYLSA